MNIFHKVSEDVLHSDIPKLYPSINWFFFYKTHNTSEKDAIKLASGSTIVPCIPGTTRGQATAQMECVYRNEN